MDGVFHIDTDQPIRRREDDIFGRHDFVQRLCKALVENKNDQVRARNTVVGLTGPWGSGKSSILNLLAEELGRRDRVIVVRFNPWLFSGRDELVNAFFNELIEKLGRSLLPKTVTIARTLSRYKKVVDAAISASSIVSPVLPPVFQVVKNLFVKKKSFSAIDLRHKAEAYIEKAGIAVVVLIDELDRVEDDEVRAVAQLIKAIGELRGISYLVAYDPTRVIDALGRGKGDERRESGAAYLEKIVQHAIPLRPLVDREIDALFRGELEKRGYSFARDKNNERLEEILDHIKSGLKTPRDIKRLIGTFDIIESMVHGEVDIIDVLGYCYLLVRIPEFHKRMADNMDKFFKYMSIDSDRTPENILDKFFYEDYYKGYHEILKLLLPSLFYGKSINYAECDRIDDCNNLIRSLYLGNPPDDISNKEMIEILNYNDKDKIIDSLKEIWGDGKLTKFFNKLKYFIEYLHSNNKKIFWTSVADLFNSESFIEYFQSHDYLIPIREGINSSMSFFYRNYDFIDNQEKRIKEIISIMIEHGDLIIIPMMMRKYLSEYGLTNLGEPPRFNERVVLSKEYIESLMKPEAERYRKAMCDGIWLKKIPSLDVFYYLSNIDVFTDEVRESLTNQLMDKDKIYRFSYLAGNGLNRNILESAIDCDRVLAKLDEFIQKGEFDEEGNPEHKRVKSLYEILKSVPADVQNAT